MKIIIKIILLCGLIISYVHAENTPAPANKVANKTAANALDKDSECTRCHDENEKKPILSIYQTAHGNKADSRTPSCQSCHGESEKHLNGKSAAPDVIFGTKTSGTYSPNETKDQNTACLTCHDKDQKRTHWQGGAHQVADVACSSCHETHAVHDKVRDKKTQPEVCFTCHKDQRAQVRKFSHHPIAEGKVACADCHNPHGSAGPKLLNKNTVTETCYTCHAEKRGPYLWEHQPVTEDCSNCHTPHGSNITPLLKSRAPFLCSECHDGPHHSKDPAAGDVAGTQGGLTNVPSDNYTGRACLNCHSLIHGSNHPAGALLQR